MVKTIWGYNVEALSSGIDKRKMGSKETKQKKRKRLRRIGENGRKQE